ncbi:MAG TPA: tetratricopeptide repeat protein [Blastocatellia bacterium]|nr:tetratricopeptide repeat protein [Blastocatellia bacterium]
MMRKQFGFALFTIAISLTGLAQTGQEARQLEPARPVEREIAGGQTHTYQINLTAGRFMRVVVEQRSADVTLALVDPGGMTLAESNLTMVGGRESLSQVAIQNGPHLIMVRAATPSAIPGAYQVQLEVRETAPERDRLRIATERLLGEASRLRGEAAIEKLQEALANWRELGDQYWEVFTLNSLGGAYRLLSRYENTIEYSEQALAISRRTQVRDGEATALTNLGIAHSIMGRQEQAIGYFEQALAVRREAKLRASEAASLSNLGATNIALGRYDRAIEWLELALAISLEIKDRRMEGVALHNLGDCYFNLSRFDRAIEHYEGALAIHREFKNIFNEATTLNNLGRTYTQLGRPDRAVEYLEQALRIRGELKDRYGEGVTLNALAMNYRQMGRFETSAEYSERALQIGREVKNPETEVSALNNLGAVAFDMGIPDRAIEYHEQALRIIREMKLSSYEADSLNNLGNANAFQGRYERAIQYYEQALALYRGAKNRIEEGRALSNIGIVYRYLGLWDKAIGRLEEALAISQTVKNRSGEGHAIFNLGDAYHSQGRFKQAIERFEQALVIFREVKNRSSEGVALSNIGYAFLSLGQPESAAQYLEQALAINREVANRPAEAKSLAGLGRAYQSLGRGEMAIGYLEQALAIHREVTDRTEEIATLHLFAEAERERGRLDRASALIEECVQLAESLRADIYNPEQRASYFASAQGAYEFYIDLLMRLHRADPGKGYDALAVQVSERARARGLLEMLAEARADIRQGVDRALLERERALMWQINARAQQLTQRRGPEQSSLNREINRLEDEYHQTRAAIRRASPRYAALAQPQPLSLPEIQQQLDEGSLLLEYSLGAERSYLWAITNKSLASYELPKREQVEEAARRVYGLLTARSRSFKNETAPQRRARLAEAAARLPEGARQLSRMLLSPVAAQLGNKRLVIVADGALQYLPFAMLPAPQNNGWSLRPLITDHEIINLPSASTLAVQRHELAGRQTSPKMLAVFADPVFAANDERMKTVAMNASRTETPAASAEAMRIIEQLVEDSATVTARRLVIPRLPFTRREADRIVAAASDAENLKAVDFQANRAVVYGTELSQYRYIHFATHGLLDSQRPGLSSLVLSLVDEQGRQQDGFLRAHEVYNLNLPAELIVLSACQTGLGKEVKGEGLVGLTRGFMYAGAARVVVSLWSVNDRATADLMVRFYRKMLKDQQRPAAALRSAQVEMLRSSQWRSPYYWSAFVLQGEWH